MAHPPHYTPHPSHAQVSPKGYPAPPHGQTGYTQHPQYQQAYSPTTSLPTHSPAQAQYYQQWQQYYQSQQAYQQGDHRKHQESSYHQQPYTAPHGQAVGYSNGPQTPNQTSTQAPQYTGGTHAYQPQFTPTSASPTHFNQRSFSNEVTTQPDQQTPLESTHPQSISTESHKAQALDYDFEEDDLNSLDIPDLPQSTLHFANASRQPVNLIGQPLPANSVVADALAPFPSPAPQDEGCCKSKYQFDASLETCLAHFKDSKYWDKDHADDVVFSDVSVDGKVVPVDQVLSAIKQRHAHPESSDETNRNSRSQSRTVSMNQDALYLNIALEKTERELAETKAKLHARLDKGRAANPVDASPLQSVKSEQPHLRDHEVKEEYRTPPRSATSEKPIKTEQDAEDVLAALGVTGAPKPITATAWPDQCTGHGSPSDVRVSRSGSSSGAEKWVHLP